jgi:hypothetical protein
MSLSRMHVPYMKKTPVDPTQRAVTGVDKTGNAAVITEDFLQRSFSVGVGK